MSYITLKQAMDDAMQVVMIKKQSADRKFGPGLFEKAIAHHMQRDLRASVVKGSVRDRDGFRSQFVDYDWADVYAENPEYVWTDFFLPFILNSVSRMSRGLEP